ncbi:hypothetical protein CK203_015437 [Vitis vinifera]|uniref:Reverse transcriptase domain-containing protein n=1 Tax=Vitis vinifera TaxID=29760 RepID=A0A438JKB6_VITVI|nr:hypothetical protein CK203_015437 [Vitis vinifera]
MTASSEVRGGLKGGKCWFAVESKTFEISIEVCEMWKLRSIVLYFQREEQLSRCLVGCFGDSFESVPPLSSLKGWALASWILRGVTLGSHPSESLWEEYAKVIVSGGRTYLLGGMKVWVMHALVKACERLKLVIRIRDQKSRLSVVEGLGCNWCSRAIPESVVGALGLEQVELTDEDFNIGGSLPGCSALTDKALMDEASRYLVYHNHYLFSLGVRGCFSSTPFLGPDEALLVSEGACSGSEGSKAGAMDWDPLQVVPTEDLLVLNGWKEPLWCSTDNVSTIELVIVPVGSGYMSPIVEMTDFQLEDGRRDEGWNSSCLPKFSRCLGMPMEGFEEEILCFLRRMKGRIDQNRQDGASRKTKLMSSKSSRELKKLEWTVNYKKTKVDTSLVGGIMVFWDNKVFELVDLEEWEYAISCRFKNCVDGIVWVFTDFQMNIVGEMGFFINEEIFRSGRGYGAKGLSFVVKFENMWLEEEGFKDQMKTWWRSLSFTGTSSFVLDTKLKALKDILKTWNKEVFDYEARKEARESYKTWVLKEEISWRQKSREVWLKEGDNNTRFFHRMTNAHNRRNWLSKLKVNGCWHTKENDLKDRLASSEVEGLKILFSEEEVFAALLELGKDKALVPKKGGAKDLKDFRSISLVGSLYKLLAKMLANRIKIVMGKVITESSNAFVDGRHILDAVLIANKVVDSRVENQSREERVNPGGRVHDIADLTLELGCKVGGLPSYYLGLLLGATFKSTTV